MVYKTLHGKLSITRRHYSFLEFYRIFGNDCFKKLLIFFIVHCMSIKNVKNRLCIVYTNVVSYPETVLLHQLIYFLIFNMKMKNKMSVNSKDQSNFGPLVFMLPKTFILFCFPLFSMLDLQAYLMSIFIMTLLIKMQFQKY